LWIEGFRGAGIESEIANDAGDRNAFHWMRDAKCVIASKKLK
jgi:hypothetical protein